jgi:hypothetical protein
MMDQSFTVLRLKTEVVMACWLVLYRVVINEYD